ncbi:uncharacterized protein B0I36DRAFT_367084 [Microdochium trichocladiopsis]|uniref:Uncharacterized protein n=1 Tax=Microdochium trichocladiopsis TaxID=1682393 RepID=A0A9P9BQ59_9PEZI|nr:uncharacterized protein B0I36DRAFT_367084 [Microdochium trichocladiopsis]KAH7025211.1 hypothetical protein B0I36DRAFT_367084 [Microdochium trichocladiopsis]
MKFLIAFLVSVVAFASAAVIDPEISLLRRELEDAAATVDADVDIADHALPDGSKKFDITIDGVYEGSVIESQNGTVQIFDVDGNEIDADDLDEVDETISEDGTVVKRNLFKFLRALAGPIRKYGSKFLKYGKCVGYRTMIECAEHVGDCARQGILPWYCLPLQWCAGVRAKNCRW